MGLGTDCADYKRDPDPDELDHAFCRTGACCGYGSDAEFRVCSNLTSAFDCSRDSIFNLWYGIGSVCGVGDLCKTNFFQQRVDGTLFPDSALNSCCCGLNVLGEPLPIQGCVMSTSRQCVGWPGVAVADMACGGIGGKPGDLLDEFIGGGGQLRTAVHCNSRPCEETIACCDFSGRCNEISLIECCDTGGTPTGEPSCSGSSCTPTEPPGCRPPSEDVVPEGLLGWSSNICNNAYFSPYIRNSDELPEAQEEFTQGLFELLTPHPIRAIEPTILVDTVEPCSYHYGDVEIVNGWARGVFCTTVDGATFTSYADMTFYNGDEGTLPRGSAVMVGAYKAPSWAEIQYHSNAHFCNPQTQ